MCYSMSKMFTSKNLVLSFALLSASVSFVDATHYLRGGSTVYITGDVTLKHLLDNANNTELRRLNELVPKSKAIIVPCLNESSDCGIHGQCRISGENKLCVCDGRYVSIEMDKPCAVEGANQLVMLIMWILFGWTGGSAFGLGLTLLGTLVLLLFCCGTCFRGAAENNIDNKKGALYNIIHIMSLLSCAGLWIYALVIMSTNKCVDSRGVPCGW